MAPTSPPPTNTAYSQSRATATSVLPNRCSAVLQPKPRQPISGRPPLPGYSISPSHSSNWATPPRLPASADPARMTLPHAAKMSPTPSIIDAKLRIGSGFFMGSNYEPAHHPSMEFSRSSSPYSISHGSPDPESHRKMMIDYEDEDDDYLHVETPSDHRCHGVDLRGLLNVFFLLIIILACLMLFAGYPILDKVRHPDHKYLNINASDQIPDLPLMPSLIDKDTPKSAYHWKAPVPSDVASGDDYELVFSDEFEEEGRTFWPGDDPYWEAMDFWYGATQDFEWYSPEGINTTDGALQLTMIQKENHNLNFQSGMLQSWNKLCFQGGYIEMAVKLPGKPNQRGYWPGLWLMANLARPGYLGSTEGLWPYSYSSCDVGTLENQTNPEGTGPYGSLHAHGQFSDQFNGRLSEMPGQRVSACTCPGEDHPGPNVKVGRGAPEVDLVEVQNFYDEKTQTVRGQASQSLQMAPFSVDYKPTSNESYQFYGDTQWNSFRGSVLQQAMSGVSAIPDNAYIKQPDAEYFTFGVQIDPDFDGDGSKGQITWYKGGKASWTAPAAMIGPQKSVGASQRLIPVEPMSIILNLGISTAFSEIHWDEVEFPAVMKVDYVRLYQRPHQHKMDCSPPDHPTKEYIENHLDLYTNPNFTVFPREKYGWPKNRLVDTC